MHNIRHATLLLMLVWAVAALAQTPTQPPMTPDSGSHSPRRISSLLAQSNMQRPKPIPVVRPLRFQEIPVAASQANTEENVGNRSDELKNVESPGGCRNAPPHDDPGFTNQRIDRSNP